MPTNLIDPKLDLVLERVVDVSNEFVWRAWTQPELVKRWFTPAPWETVACEIDLRPGGAFRTTMRSPEGQEFPNLGCYLEIVPNRKLVWTSLLLPGFRPVNTAVNVHELYFTAMIELEPVSGGTKYTATAMHRTADEAQRHAEMGFHDGWGTVLDQLVEMVKSL